MTRASQGASVIICAYTEDRWPDFVAAVTSLRQQTVVPCEIILVIDHNPVLLARAQAQFPEVVVIENALEQGLSGARNTGVAHARGALIAFLDDDASATPEWLEHMQSLCSMPNVLGAGGTIMPCWEGGIPRWFPDEFGWVVGCTYRGMPTTRRAVRNLIGAAMCVRREVFAVAGNFRADLGRVKQHPIGDEETEFCIRAAGSFPNQNFLFDPVAIVRHRVPARRKTWRYFCARCFHEGKSKAHLTRLVSANAGLASERAYTLRTLPAGICRYAGAALRGDLAGVTRSGAIIIGLICTILGYLVEKLWGRRV
jgi:glucosyl-dolichyl phosphate glucuronosyltransferase